MKVSSWIISLFIVTIMISACSNGQFNKNTSETNTDTSIEENKQSVVVTKIDNTDDSLNLDKTINPDVVNPDNEIITKEQENDRLFSVQVPQQYKRFLIDKSTNNNQTVIFFEAADIDLDGIEEAIAAFGHSNEDFTQVYIMKNVDGEIKQIGDSHINGGYNVNEIKLIELEGRDDKVIYFGLTNFDSMRGFELLALINQELELIAYSASATGVGDDQLIDADQNGKYDSYIQQRYSYDVLYYPTSRYISLVQGEFKPEHTTIDLKEYPSSPNEVVREYLSLGIFIDENAPDVHKRLADLCPSCSEYFGNTMPDAWHDILYPSLWDENLYKFVTHEEENAAEVEFSLVEYNTTKLTFHLIKEDSIWTINEIISQETKE